MCNIGFMGPYTRRDGRQIVIARSQRSNITVSYPKYLMEVSIGRYLAADEQIHHIDGNIANNSLNNLEVVMLGEHQRLHRPRINVEKLAICVWCGQSFMMTCQHVRHRKDKRMINKKDLFAQEFVLVSTVRAYNWEQLYECPQIR